MEHVTKKKTEARGEVLGARFSNTSAGFTLVEMIVSIFVFSVVMVVATGSLVSIIGANQKAQAVKSVMNNLAFALDSMERMIRVGSNYYCVDVPSCASSGAISFGFDNANGDPVVFRLEENRIERKIGDGQFLALTAPEVEIERLRFFVDGEDEGGADGQPYVVITLGGRSGVGRAETVFNIQTIATQRRLDR